MTDDLRGELQQMRELLDELLRGVRELGRERRSGKKRVLSFNEAAKRLGVSRNLALHDLIERRRIRVVNVNGRDRIPVAEIERIEREGA